MECDEQIVGRSQIIERKAKGIVGKEEKRNKKSEQLILYN